MNQRTGLDWKAPALSLAMTAASFAATTPHAPLGEHYIYDASGNMTEKTINGKTSRMAYDKANRIVSKDNANGTSERFLYDPAGRPTTVLDAQGKVLRRMDYGYADKVISTTNGQEKTDFYYNAEGMLVGKAKAGQVSTYTWDGIALAAKDNEAYTNEAHITGGTPVLAGGNEVVVSDYLGSTLLQGERAFDSTAYGEGLEAGRFTSKMFVEELVGFVFPARVYSAIAAHWTTVDPTGFPDTMNNRAYPRDSFTQVDPLGTEAAWTPCSVKFAVTLQTNHTQMLDALWNATTQTPSGDDVDVDTLFTNKEAMRVAIGMPNNNDVLQHTFTQTVTWEENSATPKKFRKLGWVYGTNKFVNTDWPTDPIKPPATWSHMVFTEGYDGTTDIWKLGSFEMKPDSMLALTANPTQTTSSTFGLPPVPLAKKATATYWYDEPGDPAANPVVPANMELKDQKCNKADCKKLETSGVWEGTEVGLPGFKLMHTTDAIWYVAAKLRQAGDATWPTGLTQMVEVKCTVAPATAGSFNPSKTTKIGSASPLVELGTHWSRANPLPGVDPDHPIIWEIIVNRGEN